jgi:hypothetical protein
MHYRPAHSKDFKKYCTVHSEKCNNFMKKKEPLREAGKIVVAAVFNELPPFPFMQSAMPHREGSATRHYLVARYQVLLY